MGRVHLTTLGRSRVNIRMTLCNNVETLAHLLLGWEGAELSFRLCSCFLVFFVSYLICKINLNPCYLWCLDGRVVSMSGSESVGPCSIARGRVLNFSFYFLFSS